jgi:homoserine acetyltransferase
MLDAISRVKARVATASITTDILYPPHQQIKIQQMVETVGGECSYVEIDDNNGHDGFLLATKEIGEVFSGILSD